MPASPEGNRLRGIIEIGPLRVMRVFQLMNIDQH
jgi:hypothetical protein